MGRYGNLDYPTLTKRGFALGLLLIAIGVVGQTILPVVAGPLPGWEATLFLDAEALGVVLCFFVPIVFGIVLPLTE